MSRTGLLAIGEAAILLRSTRRQVVDLCARGLLPYVIVGSARRIRRTDVEALVSLSLTREQLEQLWLHRAIAVRLAENQASVLSVACANLLRLRSLHQDDTDVEWLDRWQIVLDGGPEAVSDVLTSPFDHAVRLRERSPFAGVLSEMERRKVLSSLSERRRLQVRLVRWETRGRVLRAV